MISLDDYTSQDGLGLAGLVARKEVTAKELADAARQAIDKVNPRINAVLQTLPAESASGSSQGPFAGVPFLIKELVLHAKNVRCDAGCRLAQGFVPTEDTELMARFRKAGLGLVGTTQTPELGYNPTTETKLFGPVHNPWDLARSPGGSSGGSGAPGAAGLVPLPHAKDRGGSVPSPPVWHGAGGLEASPARRSDGTGYQAPVIATAPA